MARECGSARRIRSSSRRSRRCRGTPPTRTPRASAGSNIGGVKLASFGAIVLLAACAHRGPATAECDRFTGSYVLDPASCHDSRGLLQLFSVAKWPNDTVIEPTPTLVGIHQDGCELISFVFRERRGFAINVAEGEARWENGALTHTRR